MTMLPVPFDELVEGTRFETRGRTVTEADVVAFAGQTGDWHPQHSDAEWAAQSEFGERIAHGMLVLSYAVGLLAFDPERVLALRRVADAVFKRPVRLGDTVRVRGAVQTCAPVSDEAGLVTLGFQIVNQYDQTVIRARVEVVWRRETTAAVPEMDNVPDNGFVPIPL
jgi:3-hydroxybutyryl-CoA dehydratase